MQLLDISAVPHPAGNRIDIAWTLPPSPAFPRVRVVRRAGTHPTDPNPASAAQGVVVPEAPGGDAVVDSGLRGETVYYYGLFPYTATGPGNTIVVSDPAEQIDRLNRASAMATSPLGLAEEMYALLPLIYHRYDTALPRDPAPDLDPGDRTRGALRRFLELPGGQCDQVYSFARALLDAVALNRVDGALLPLLAQWIGWSTDYKLEIDAQRNEVRNAPRIYRTIGVVPAIEATVKRISGNESRTKEFVHNVAATNRPERLNLWSRERANGSFGPAQLLSLDASFDGRPAAVRETADLLWLFYHKEEGGRWSIWAKTLTPQGWTPSHPISEGALRLKDPSAAMQATRLVLFWGAYDADRGLWRVESRSRSGGVWSPVETFVPPEGGATIQRRHPVAVSDDTGGLWLFWLEEVDRQWVLKYNRHDGTGWQVDPSPTFPPDAGAAPRVLDDVAAVFHPTSAGQRLWVFWARQDPAVTPGQSRWTVAYRVKAGLDPTDAGDWSQIRTLPKAAGDDDHDREPSPSVQGTGDLEVFWSSHRGGRWSVWGAVLNQATKAWGTPEELGAPPYSVRAPVSFARATATVLVFRSSESLRYASATYTATETVDFRYAGSTTVDTRNAGKLALHGSFDDFGTYVYDAGREGVRTMEDWYARDTVGVYITAPMDAADISRLGQVLPEFMPATDRAVIIKDS